MSVVVASAAAAFVMALPGGGAAAASMWTEVASGTTHDITGIEYQASDRFWYVTAAGEIFKRRVNGSFERRYGPSSVPLNDIEFQPDGLIGSAVGNGGQVLRSTDGGESWASVNTGGQPIPVSDKGNFPNCKSSDPLGDVNSVRFAGTDRVYIFAEGAQLARSAPVNPENVGSVGTWVDANRDTHGTPSATDDTCKVAPGSGGIDDGFFVPSNPDVGYICTAFLGKVYFTNSNLDAAASKKADDCGNGSSPNRHMTGDPENPNRMWAVSPGGSTPSFTRYTDDGWQTSQNFKIGNAGQRSFANPYDVDFAGGTVLVAGESGMILNSVNGRKFFYNDKPGSLSATDWRSVGLASATKGAVGGVGGKLITTGLANRVDNDPPETTITKKPRARTHDRTPTFKFVSDEPGSTFKCKLDRNRFRRCTSPKTLKRLSFGRHTFKVKAKDKAGNVDPTPAKRIFKVIRRRR